MSAIKRVSAWLAVSALAACSGTTPVKSGKQSLADDCGTQSLTLSSSAAPGSLAALDLNGDGFTNLVIPNGVNVSVFLGDGNGGFGPEVTFGNAAETAQLAVADSNGDGIPDIVSADGYDFGTLEVLLGNGDGTFGAPNTLTAGGASAPW